jgi:multidrug efflux pump subunit AcrA (membrane-fusion protein)
MKTTRFKYVTTVLIIVGLGLGWFIVNRFQEKEGFRGNPKQGRIAPVEVAEIQRGPIVLRRTFSGTLEAAAKFVVAPKVSGRAIPCLIPSLRQ